MLTIVENYSCLKYYKTPAVSYVTITFESPFYCIYGSKIGLITFQYNYQFRCDYNDATTLYLFFFGFSSFNKQYSRGERVQLIFFYSFSLYRNLCEFFMHLSLFTIQFVTRTKDTCNELKSEGGR